MSVPEVEIVEYVIGEEAISIPFPLFESEDVTRCGYTWQYTVSLLAPPEGGASMSTYLSYNEAESLILVYSTEGLAP